LKLPRVEAPGTMSKPQAETIRVGSSPDQPWYRGISSYQWFVLVVASMGWMFDTMTQQLFNLARRPAIADLLGTAATSGQISKQAGYSTMIFMIGWAIGGLLFGVLGDRLGRVKTMAITLLLYSGFTGLSYFSHSLWDFDVYRFLCSLGVGGQFAVGVSLVAETMPERARAKALGLLQALSTVGNMAAALAGIVLGHLENSGVIKSSWRLLFLIGAVPAPLVLLILKKMKEPAHWLQARSNAAKMGSLSEMFQNPIWRRNAIVGAVLAFAGVVGLWGIGFFSFDLFRPVLEKSFQAQGFSGNSLAGKTTTWIGITSLLQNAGGFLGIYWFTYFTGRVGRRKAFAFSFFAAMVATAFTFWRLETIKEMFWMIPIMGFTQLALFGGYAIYLPELFPTRLRSTGTSLCYNVGRLVAAVGPLGLGLLTSTVYAGPNAMRYAGITMSSVFLVGLTVLPIAPETKDCPLPQQ
jgi:MFS family permease